MSLRRGLSFFVITLATLAMVAGISLVVLTTHLHRTTRDMENGLHSVKIAEELQIDLLTYLRSQPSERRSVEFDLRQSFREAQKYVNTPEEAAALTEAQQYLELHFSKVHQAGSDVRDDNLQSTFTALRRFVDINVAQADDALTQSEEWDAAADRIGLGVAATLLLGTAAMLVWLRAVAFRPVFEICTALRDFAAGDKSARASVYGPEELRGIAALFNEMADALARQQHNQAAFLAGVAHDLRTPLSAVTLSADALSREEISSEMSSKLIGVIKRQVGSLDRMVGDLLDSSNIESGQLELRMEHHDARRLAEDAFRLFSSSSNAHQFALDLPAAPLPIHCDNQRIQQVLNNLMSNAIKYSPAGGRIVLSLVEEGGEAVFAVLDEGLGISREDIPYIFEPFRRSRTSANIPGVGLGLSVAQRIVRAHGGRIVVESQIGNGARFSVRLPSVAQLQRASA